MLSMVARGNGDVRDSIVPISSHFLSYLTSVTFYSPTVLGSRDTSLNVEGTGNNIAIDNCRLRPTVYSPDRFQSLTTSFSGPDLRFHGQQHGYQATTMASLVWLDAY